ncbi:MAG TPA: sodium/proton antiporter NhaB [Gammaproteobacteria bacterium]|nr:sodium/proton antiporter NhaB [Gammaproteobacteria bacterium]
MASGSMRRAFAENFLGNSPDWYKLTIIAFLVINPFVAFTLGGTIAGWLLVGEFIFTLAMALKCYPLQPGGLLAIEAVVIGLTSAESVYHHTEAAFPVILLLIFMVAGIYFLKELLLFTFTKILLGIRSKILLSLMFCFVAAVLSAFLDALTVTAVVITVASGFYGVFHKVASGKRVDHDQDHDHDHDQASDDQVHELHRADLEHFRGFLRNLVMHAAVGTALGGVMTLVGEPQNLLIATVSDWDFLEFFVRMSPVSVPVFVVGLATCALVERFSLFSYGERMPEAVREVLTEYDRRRSSRRTRSEKAVLVAQALVTIVLVIGLGFHLAQVGIIGLMIIVLATAFTGVIEERRIGHAFEEALPFTALLVVFFAIVAVIADHQLFSPVIGWVLLLEGSLQTAMFYIANGVLSMISDNVFVATIYITEVKEALDAGQISRDVYDMLAVAINTGTNIPSVATPNGQAAFLFLLTSALAPLIRLSYMRMVLLALPYTITMTLTGFAAVFLLLH